MQKRLSQISRAALLVLPLVGLCSIMEAQAAPVSPFSDEMKITTLNGTTLYTGSISEATPEPALIYQTGIPTAVDNANWWATQMTTNSAAIRVVGLLEPVGEQPTPGEQIVTISGVGVLSDLVIAIYQPSQNKLAVGMFSDGHPLFGNTNLVNILGSLGTKATYLTETGQFQNISSSLGLQNLGIVQVRSDVAAVPIPAAALMFGSGLVGLVGFLRKKLTLA